MSSELLIPKIDDLEKVDFKPQGLQPVIDKVKELSEGFSGDISTAKGRDEIKSYAFKFSKVKARVEEKGKAEREDYNKMAKEVIDEQKRCVEAIVSAQKLVRSRLDEWEKKESDRKERHQSNLDELILIGESAEANWQEFNVELVKSDLKQLVANAPGENWDEYQDDALLAFEKTIEQMQKAIDKRQQYDSEQKELAELRKIKAEQEAKAEKERLEIEAREKAEKEVYEKLAREKAKKEDAIERAKQAELKAEADRKQAIKDAEDAKIAAEKKAKKEAEAAARLEREKIKEEKIQEAFAAKKRKEDKAHMAKINNEALKALKAGGFLEDDAKKFIRMVVSKEVPNISIQY